MISESEIIKDTIENRYFLKTDFNRDENSYRSPYSNKYFPPKEDAPFPARPLR